MACQWNIKWIFYVLCIGLIMFCLGWLLHSTSDLHNCLTYRILQSDVSFDQFPRDCPCCNNSAAAKGSYVVDPPPDKENASIPTIFFITPTYKRPTQKADLTRLCQTLMHVRNLHWILVEDSEGHTPLVTRFLNGCPVRSTHLSYKTSKELRPKKSFRGRVQAKNRGTEQRNIALNWLNETYRPGELCGVVYFGDDDNTYDIKLFKEMRYTKKVSVWPVGLVGDLLAEGPVCRNGRVVSWHVAWAPNRKFPVDMAAFAINLDVILTNPQARLNPFVQLGHLETELLSRITTVEELEAKANDCTKVYVWHTQTKTVRTNYEKKFPTTQEVKR